MIKKTMIMISLIICLIGSVYSAPSILFNPDNTYFEILQGDGFSYIHLTDSILIDNSFGNFNISSVINFGYYTYYNTEFEDQVVLLDTYSQYISSDSSFYVQDIPLPFIVEDSGIYFVDVAFEDFDNFVYNSISINDVYNYTYVPYVQPIETESEVGVLGNLSDSTITPMFSVINAIINGMVVLITGNLVVLVIVSAFITFIIGIFVMSLVYLRQNVNVINIKKK